MSFLVSNSGRCTFCYVSTSFFPFVRLPSIQAIVPTWPLQIEKVQGLPGNSCHQIASVTLQPKLWGGTISMTIVTIKFGWWNWGTSARFEVVKGRAADWDVECQVDQFACSIGKQEMIRWEEGCTPRGVAAMGKGRRFLECSWVLPVTKTVEMMQHEMAQSWHNHIPFAYQTGLLLKLRACEVLGLRSDALSRPRVRILDGSSQSNVLRHLTQLRQAHNAWITSATEMMVCC